MNHYPIENLRSFLEGRWEIRRVIDDLRAELTGRFEGVGVFTPTVGDRLSYREQGLLVIGTYTGSVSREYLYTFPEPHRAEVLFEDGRPFHGLDLSTGASDVEHLCHPDHYRATFTVEGPRSWRFVWRVRGPRKDSRLMSHLFRIVNAA